MSRGAVHTSELNISSCPHCASEDGMYQTLHKHYEQYYNFKGETLKEGEMGYDRTTVLRCSSCHKILEAKAI